MQYKINVVLSEGICFGKAKNIILNEIKITNSYTFIDVKEAINKTINDLNNINNSNEKDYIEIQKMILNDKYLLEKIENHMNTSPAVDSIKMSFDEFLKGLVESNSFYLKERVSDLIDIRDHIIRNLIGDNEIILDDKYILIIDEIYPSMLIHNLSNIIGIISKRGGFSSHSAIICRNNNIPYVLVDNDVKCNNIIIDTTRNIIISNPDNILISKFNDYIKLKSLASDEVVKHDGFFFLANCNSNNDVEMANKLGFDGVGLYRTELIFINNNEPLSEDKQCEIYTEAIKSINNKEIVFRTFDVGDDKVIKYISSKEKGISNYLNNPLIFISQVKALLRASNGNIKIMFPMIRANDEFLYLKEWVLKIAKSLNTNIPSLGMMLETKDALNDISSFTTPDFISIGTNDLTSELYNIDRENSSIKYQDYIDDLIDKLKIVVEHSNKYNISLSVCGELASITDIALKLYKIGIKSLSVSPSLINHLNISYLKYKNE